MEKRTCTEEDILAWIHQGKRFVCFGIGDMQRKLFEKIPLASHMRQITDFDPALWGRYLNDGKVSIPIMQPEKVLVDGDEIVIITTPYHQQVEATVRALDNWRSAKALYYIPSVSDRNFNDLQMELSRLPLQKKLVFRSGLEKYVKGFDYSDNSQALFEYLVAHGFPKHYVLVWYVHEPDDFPKLKKIENVFVVSYEWSNSSRYEEYFTYFYHLYTAKYLFTTDTFFWMRYCREGQMRINLWHGCGFKDRKKKNGPTGRYYDFMTVTSSLYADIHAEEYGCAREQLLVTGLAKQDWLFQPFDKTLSELFDLPVASKYVFWLPTFRMAADGLEGLNEYEMDSDTGFPIVKNEAMFRELDRMLQSFGMCLIVKLHPIQKNSCLVHWNFDRIRVVENSEIATKGIPVNRLLAAADALISDYSSAAVDYMLLDRPIAFMLEDMEQYKNSRGFVFDDLLSYLPGKLLFSFEDLKVFLGEVAAGEDSSAPQRRRLMPLMHAYRDGNNCKRILDAIGIG